MAAPKFSVCLLTTATKVTAKPSFVLDLHTAAEGEVPRGDVKHALFHGQQLFFSSGLFQIVHKEIVL